MQWLICTLWQSANQWKAPEDTTQDQMEKLICTLCQSVKRNKSILKMQLEINAETYLYDLPISEKQHINPEDATWNQCGDLSVRSDSLPISEKHLRIQLKIKWRDLSEHSANQWKGTNPPWGCNSRSNAETYLYDLPISEKQHINPEDATWNQCRDLSVCSGSLPISEKHLRIQLKIKWRDLSVRSANQWKTTHPPWGCNSRSNVETYLYALPISEKQHIHPEDANWDRMQRLICTLCQSVKNNTSTLRMSLEIKCRDLSVRSANQWKATH